MLVLSRKSKESVVVGGRGRFEPTLKVTVLEIKSGSVRLGFEADASVPVHRAEVWERIRESRQAGGSQENPAADRGGLRAAKAYSRSDGGPIADRGRGNLSVGISDVRPQHATISGGGECMAPVLSLYRPIPPRNAGSPLLRKIPLMRSIWQRWRLCRP